jgi:hypothetical protein
MWIHWFGLVGLVWFGLVVWLFGCLVSLDWFGLDWIGLVWLGGLVVWLVWIGLVWFGYLCYLLKLLIRWI